MNFFLLAMILASSMMMPLQEQNNSISYGVINYSLENISFPDENAQVKAELPIYYDSEPYQNFSRFGIANYKTGTYFTSCGSASMYPTLTCNDTLIIVPKFTVNITLGDIVIFHASQWKHNWVTPTEYVLHRIIGKGYDENGTYYVTKGDNNPVDDNVKVRYKDITWVVRGVWKK